MSEIREGQKVRITSNIPTVEKGETAIITDVDHTDHFPYEINDGEDRVSERIVEVSHCICGQEMLYSKKRGRICPWCNL